MNKRIVFWDVLKIWLAIMVVAHHSAQAYGPTGGQWLVKNQHSLPWLRPFLFVNAAYLMGMYFFIAGYFSRISLERKNPAEFLKDRVRRLLIPALIISLLVFIPMFGVLDNWRQPWHFYLIEYYFRKPPLAVGHLWFLLTLMVFSVILLLVTHRLPVKILFKRYHFVLTVIALSLITATVRAHWPIDRWVTIIIPVEPAHWPQYLTVFFVGYLYRFWNWERQINPFEITACFIISASLLALTAVLGSGLWLSSCAETFFGLSVTLWLPTIMRNVSWHDGRLVRLLSENNYGIYLFHLFWILALQFLFNSVQLQTWAKWLIVTFLGFAGAFLTSLIFRTSTLIRKFI